MTTDLRATVRVTMHALDEHGPKDPGTEYLVGQVRIALAERGLGADCHVGKSDLDEERTVEWYAGQLLALIDNTQNVTAFVQILGLRSMVSRLDEFVPEKPKRRIVQ